MSGSPSSKDSKEGGGEKKAVAVAPIICPGHSRPVPDLEYSRVTEDGYFIISSCLDGKAMLREGVSGDWIGTFIGHKGAVWSARLNKEATKAVTASGDFTAKLWDAVTGTELADLPHRHIVKMAVFSEDGASVYTGGQEKKLRVFDLAKPEEPRVLEGHSASINSIVCPTDPNLLLTGAAEKDIKVWDLRTGSVVKTLETAEPCGKMTMSGDRSVVVTTAGKEVSFFKADTLEKLKSYELERVIDCAAFHASTGKFATGCDTELWVRVHDFETGKETACNKGHHGPVRSLAFSPDGVTYASGSEDGTIRIWETATAANAGSE